MNDNSFFCWSEIQRSKEIQTFLKTKSVDELCNGSHNNMRYAKLLSPSNAESFNLITLFVWVCLRMCVHFFPGFPKVQCTLNMRVTQIFFLPLKIKIYCNNFFLRFAIWLKRRRKKNVRRLNAICVCCARFWKNLPIEKFCVDFAFFMRVMCEAFFFTRSILFTINENVSK